MKVTKSTVGKDGCCNFCSRGKMKTFSVGLDYPYKIVYTFTRDSKSGLYAVICRDCSKELKKAIR